MTRMKEISAYQAILVTLVNSLVLILCKVLDLEQHFSSKKFTNNINHKCIKFVGGYYWFLYKWSVI